jgi:hypothetical protein
MYEKEFPREPMDTVAGDPCISVDGYSFIWTSTMFMFCRYKKKIKNEEDQRPWKTEDEDKGKRRYKT